MNYIISRKKKYTYGNHRVTTYLSHPLENYPNNQKPKQCCWFLKSQATNQQRLWIFPDIDKAKEKLSEIVLNNESRRYDFKIVETEVRL